MQDPTGRRGFFDGGCVTTIADDADDSAMMEGVDEIEELEDAFRLSVEEEVFLQSG